MGPLKPDGWIGGLYVVSRSHVGRLKGAAGASALSVQYGLIYFTLWPAWTGDGASA